MPHPGSMPPTDLLADMRWLRRFAGQLVQDVGEVDDITQDAWVRALESAPVDIERSRVRAWLKRVTRNLVAHRWRDEAVRREHEARRARETSSKPVSEDLERLELLHRLAGTVLELDEPNRAAIVLRFQHELPYPQIAQRLGVTEAAARKRVSRGLVDLRERLERAHGGREDWRRAYAAFSAPQGAVWPFPAVRWIAMATTLCAGLAVAGWFLVEGTTSADEADLSWRFPAAGSLSPGSDHLASPEELEALARFETYFGHWQPLEDGEAIEYAWGLEGKTIRVREFVIRSGKERLLSEGVVGWHPGLGRLVFQEFFRDIREFESIQEGHYWFDDSGALWREFQVYEPDQTHRAYRERLAQGPDQSWARSVEYQDDAGAWRGLCNFPVLSN